MNLLQHSGSIPLSYACPGCRVRLVERERKCWHCPSCGVEYPLISDTIPVLVQNPLRYLSGERQILMHDATQNQGIGEYYLQSAEQAGIRQETLRQLGQGLIQNGKFLEELSSRIPVSDVEATEHGLALGADLFAALRKDWSGSAETEKEIGITLQAILATLAESPPQKTLVLGAGAGRALCEIEQHFPGAVGIDLSSAMATAFSRLIADGELSAYLLHQGNFLRGADECEAIHARHELAPGLPQYVIADAARIPFSDETFDAVVSNYFTDILPLSKWLPEARRVLKPTGRLIHFGPLGYAFGEIVEHYAVDQLPAAFELHGFEMTPPSLVRNNFYGSANRLNRFELENLLFVALPINE